MPPQSPDSVVANTVDRASYLLDEIVQPAAWPKSIRRAMDLLDVVTWRELCDVGRMGFLAIKGVGVYGVQFVSERIADRGLTWTNGRPCELDLNVHHLAKPQTGVYFVRCGSYVKIGYASDVRKRLQQLVCGSPYPFVLLAVHSCDTVDAAKDLEDSYHEIFESCLHRYEWFVLGPRLEATITTLRQKADAAKATDMERHPRRYFGEKRDNCPTL